MGWFNRKKRAQTSTLQQKNRLSTRLKSPVANYYIVDCDVEFKGKKISRIKFKTSGRSRRDVALDIEKEIKIRVVKVNRTKK